MVVATVLFGGDFRGVCPLAFLDDRDDLGGGVLLDFLVDRSAQPGGRLLSAARGGVSLRDRGDGLTVGSAISTWAVGQTLDVTHSYTLVFIGLSLLMPVALVVGFSLMGRVEMVRDFD